MFRCVARSLHLLFLFALCLPAAAAASPDTEDEPDPKRAKFEEIASADTMIMVPMRDGTGLATDVYLPKDRDGLFPVIFVKTPYDFNRIEGSQLDWGLEAIERGYAYVVQNERGRYYSEGEWELLGHPRTDGVDSLSWIAEQDWSNGKVGALGCSSTAEWQLALAAMDHPAHQATVPMAAGAGIGRVGEFQRAGQLVQGRRAPDAVHGLAVRRAAEPAAAVPRKPVAGRAPATARNL